MPTREQQYLWAGQSRGCFAQDEYHVDYTKHFRHDENRIQHYVESLWSSQIKTAWKLALNNGFQAKIYPVIEDNFERRNSKMWKFLISRFFWNSHVAHVRQRKLEEQTCRENGNEEYLKQRGKVQSHGVAGSRA